VAAARDDCQRADAEREPIVLLASLLRWHEAAGAELPWHDKLESAVVQLHIQVAQRKAQQQLPRPALDAAGLLLAAAAAAAWIAG
jgi:hypothetical protein